MDTDAAWKAIKKWADATPGVTDDQFRQWKSRKKLSRDAALDLLTDETYRRYGLRKADVMALTGRAQ